jgi:hypothetical protein
LAVNFRYAETLRVGDLLADDARALFLGAEGVGIGAQGVLENVVAQNDSDGAAVNEIFGQAQGLGDAAGFILNLVGEAALEIAAGAEQVDHVAHVFRARNNQNLVNAGANQFFDRDIDHGLWPNRQKMLVGNLGQRH